MEYTRIGHSARSPGLVARVDATAGQALRFATGQIIEGVVMEVRGAQATIALSEGRVIAESRTPLQTGDSVRLLVTSANSEQIQLQMLRRQPGLGVRALTDQDLNQLIASFGLESSDLTRGIVREILAQGQPLVGKTVQRLASLLAHFRASGARPGAEHAFIRAAVWLQARGLPIAPRSLELASNRLAQLPTVTRLLDDAWLQAMALKNHSPAVSNLANQLEHVLRQLAFLEGDQLPSDLPNAVRAKIDQLGSPLENKVALWLEGQIDDGALLRDVRLQLGRVLHEIDRTLASLPAHNDQARALESLQKTISAVAQSLEAEQMLNAKHLVANAPAASTSIAFHLPWSGPPNGDAVQLRIVPDTESSSRNGRRRHRLVMDFDLETLERLSVDLTVFGERVVCRFAADADETQQLFAEYKTTLEEAISRLGYHVDVVPGEFNEDSAEREGMTPQVRLQRIDTTA